MPSVQPEIENMLLKKELIDAGLDALAKQVYLEDEGFLRRNKSVFGSMTVFARTSQDLHATKDFVKIGSVIKSNGGWRIANQLGPLYREATGAAAALLRQTFDQLLKEKAESWLAENTDDT